MKLTPSVLRKLVLEEVAKLKSEKLKSGAAKEVDADEFADSLEHQVNALKAFGIKEAKLTKELALVKERKARLLKRLSGA